LSGFEGLEDYKPPTNPAVGIPLPIDTSGAGPTEEEFIAQITGGTPDTPIAADPQKPERTYKDIPSDLSTPTSRRQQARDRRLARRGILPRAIRGQNVPDEFRDEPAAPAAAPAAEAKAQQEEKKQGEGGFSQAKYNRLLRTNGQAVANRYARANNKTFNSKKNPRQQFSDQQRGQVATVLKILKSLGFENPADLLKVAGGAQNFNQGGGTEDNIPAMLTKGEFVVNPKSAKKIGMKSLEKMNATGETPAKFAKGGVVGGAKTSYLQNGGSPNGGMGPLEINIGPFSDVLNKFNAAFGSTLDNIVGKFDALGSAMNNLSATISQGMKVNHSFSGDMTMTFNLPDSAVSDIVKSVADAITPKMKDIIKQEVDKNFNKNSFKSGG